MTARILQSGIPNAGNGLFADHFYASGAIVSAYTGRFTREEIEGDRVLEYGRRRTIDAAVKECRCEEGRGDMVNSSKDNQNCTFKVINKRKGIVAVVTTKAVNAGDEFFVYYGPQYIFARA